MVELAKNLQRLDVGLRQRITTGNIMFIRHFSHGRILMDNSPRFVTTLKAGAKPALEKSMPITRPFGLDTPILLNRNIGNTYTLGNIKNELFSPEAKERRQKKLDYEITHSPFYESRSFRNTNGKIFTPPISYFKLDKAKYFPDFIASTLDSQKKSLFDLLEGKISIIQVYLTVSGQQCVESWFKDFDPSKFLNSQRIDVNIPANWLKGFIIGLSKNSIKKTIPEDRWNKYFILPDHIWQYDVREKLLCDNMCSGYLYVVDHNGKIRWATSGSANEDESKLFEKVLKGLQKEIEALEK